MKLGRINHIGLITGSMEQSLAFYRGMMGAETIREPLQMEGPAGALTEFLEPHGGPDDPNQNHRDMP